MRVDPNLSSLLNAGIESTAQSLQTAVQQLSSGKRVMAPSDDSGAAAANLRSLATSSRVDSYTKSCNAVLSSAQMADSALSSVVSELTQAVSLGTRGADGSMSAGNRAAIATQVQAVQAQVVSQANVTYNGHSLFVGTSDAGSAFVADAQSPTGYAYQGNSGVNQASIGDGLRVQTNVPGDQIFDDPGASVLGSLSGLISALNSGSTADIASATASVSSALSHVSQQRAVYAATVSRIDAQESFLSQESVTLSSEQGSLTGVDMSSAITAMTQAQTAHSAILAAAAKVLPTSLLDYLK